MFEKCNDKCNGPTPSVLFPMCHIYWCLTQKERELSPDYRKSIGHASLTACGHACPLIIIIKSKHLNACPAHRFRVRTPSQSPSQSQSPTQSWVPLFFFSVSSLVARHVCLPCSDLQVLLKSKLSNVQCPLSVVLCLLSIDVAASCCTFSVAHYLQLVEMREKLCVRGLCSVHFASGSSSLSVDWIALHCVCCMPHTCMPS